ncbi:MAG: hypothetical protein JO115_07860 [Pseudonocardiales bacterium]|nr:hypothetical protein [Pseudonocardiales bacterium]
MAVIKGILFWPFLLAGWLLTPRVHPSASVKVVQDAESVAERVLGLIKKILRHFGLDYMALAGGGIVGLRGLVWGILRRSLSDVDVGSFFAKFAGGTIVALVGVVVVSTLLLATCCQDRAGMVRRMMRGPWLAVAIWLAGFGLLYLNSGGKLEVALRQASQGFRPANLLQLPLDILLQLFLGLIIVLQTFWVPSLLLGLTWYAFKHSLRAIDAHPLMPALLTPWFFWGAVVALFGTTDVRNGPHFVAEAVTAITTAVVVTVFSVVEYQVASEEHGVSLSSGLPPLLGDEWGQLSDYSGEPHPLTATRAH